MPTANYNAVAAQFSKEAQWIIEIDLDQCAETYTVAPCAATDLGDGKRCFYSFFTCQDLANYNRAVRTYRFCLNDVPWHLTNEAWPLLEKFTPVPQSIDARRLFTFPEKIKARMILDFNPEPVDSEKGLADALSPNQNLDGWTATLPDNHNVATGNGTITEETTTVHTAGGSSAKLTKTVAALAGCDISTAPASVFTLAPGEWYVFEFYYRGNLATALQVAWNVWNTTDLNATGNIYLQFDGSWGASSNRRIGTLLNTWRRFRIRFQANPAANAADTYRYAVSNYGTTLQDVYVDDISLRPEAFNTARTGEFWRNLFARNRNWLNRPMRIKRGFNDATIGLSDFEQVGPEYLLTGYSFDPSGKTVTLTAESPLALLDKARTPAPTSKDNMMNAIGAGATTITITDASEIPDPAALTRNRVFVEIEDQDDGDEIMEVTGRNTTTNQLTVVRGQLGTSDIAHLTAGDKLVKNIAVFGTVTNGVLTARNRVEILQDLYELAGIDAATVDTAAYDSIKELFWPDDDLKRIVRRPEKVAKMVQEIRELSGLLVFIDQAGKWSLRAIAPQDDTTIYGDAQFVRGSVAVQEDTEAVLTRVLHYFNPLEENPREPSDFGSAVVVIFADQETVNAYGRSYEEVILDPWTDTSRSASKIRNDIRRMITRRAFGVRTFTFDLEVKDGLLNVGDSASLETEKFLDAFGAADVRPVVITARRERTESVNSYEAFDTNVSGRFLRIGPDTMAVEYDDATAEDKQYGYWGDADNRVGSTKEKGYVFW